MPVTCPLLQKIPFEVRLQIWEYVAEETPRFGHYWSSCGSFAISEQRSSKRKSSSWRGALTTNRQINEEIGPIFYEKVCLVVPHPNQFLLWVQTISPRNSACIRHLVVKYHSLLLDFNEPKRVVERGIAWSAALKTMPHLLSITFDFNEDHRIASKRAASDKSIDVHDTVILTELTKSALAWSKIQGLATSLKTMNFQYYPQRNPPDSCGGPHRQFNHVVIAIDEEVPFPLQRFFAKHLETTYASLDFPVTGLPTSFFEHEDLQLVNTYALNNDKTKKVSIVLSYQKGPRRQITTTPDKLSLVMAGLPIKYLRLGCRHIDSQGLYQIPSLTDELVSLDLAFTELDPNQVVRYLDHVQSRCPALYTLAIAVSPLHDRDPDDPKPEKFFKRTSVGTELAAKWKPFWDKIDQMNANDIRVWEGEVRYQMARGLDPGLRLSSPRSPR